MSNTLGDSLPVNIGATDFTIEFWLRFKLGHNTSGPCQEGGNNWIYGNIIFDRDIFGDGGRIAFWVNNGDTICENTALAANTRHHIAVVRLTSGKMRIFANGVLDRQYDGPAGNVSYRVGQGITNNQWYNEPFLVNGAEKHDYAPITYPSFSGWVDEVRISNLARYASNFTPPFAPDANTVGLCHFNEGSGTVVQDSSGAAGGPSHGQRQVGGLNNGLVYDAATKRF